MAKYYAINGQEIAIGEEKTLKLYYKTVKKLPADYYERKYIVSGGVLVIDTTAENEEKLAALDAQYEAEKALLMQYFNEAQFAGDTEEIENLKTEKVSLDDWYIDKRSKIEGSEK